MILGADNQNKNLSKAASKRIDTSPRTRTSNALAASISSRRVSSSAQSNAESKVDHQPRSRLSDGGPDPVRGSMEGLIKQSAGHIQMNGDGYDNPAIQKARYQKQFVNSGSFKEAISNKVSDLRSSRENSGIISNYSSKFNGDNIGNKMKEYLSTEKMFR